MTHNRVPDVTQLKFAQLKLFNYSDLNKLLLLLLLRKTPTTSSTTSSSSCYLLLPPARLHQEPGQHRHSLISAVTY